MDSVISDINDLVFIGDASTAEFRINSDLSMSRTVAKYKTYLIKEDNMEHIYEFSAVVRNKKGKIEEYILDEQIRATNPDEARTIGVFSLVSDYGWAESQAARAKIVVTEAL